MALSLAASGRRSCRSIDLRREQGIADLSHQTQRARHSSECRALFILAPDYARTKRNSLAALRQWNLRMAADHWKRLRVSLQFTFSWPEYHSTN
jgi:hypothetical protein